MRKKKTELGFPEERRCVMKFEILYILARFRGLFPDNHKGTFVYGKPQKDTVREMYYRGGYVPYRIDNLVTYK